MNKREVLYLPVKKEGLIFSTDDSECKRYYRTLDGEEVSSSFKAKSKEELLDQLKPVVPKFVAEWIEKYKKQGKTLYMAMDAIHYSSHPCRDWFEVNQETFAFAWIYGFEIEKEKLYTVEIPNPNRTTEPIIYLSRDERGKIFLNSWFLLGGQNWKKHHHSHLTEAEIKKDFEWAWNAGFAKEVE